MTRSNRNKQLINLSNQDLAKLERENRKAAAQAKMNRPIVLRETADGHLVDAQGHRYDMEGHRLDNNGAVIPEEPIAEEQNGGDEELTLAEYNRPDKFYANRSAIRPPPFERHDFELKLQYYTVVGQNQFHGLPTDHPMDHLERFEGIVGGIKANGVSSDYLHCKLFPYSLAGEALNWLNTQPPGAFTTWDATRKAFLVNFFDDALSEELRTKISTFEQGPKESFKNAWIRFKKLQRDCPHHGFTDPQLLSTFFKGVDWRYQQSLDSASNGNFMTRNSQQAIQLINNLTQSNSTKTCDEVRAREARSNPQDMAEVKASLQSIQNMLLNKKKAVTFVDEVERFGQQEDVNFIGGAGFQGQQFPYQNDRIFTAQNSGYTRNYGANEYKKPTEEGIQNMLEQLLEGQNRMTGEFNGKIDSLYQEMNSKFDAIHAHMKNLDTQVAQTAEAARRQESRNVANPRQHVNAISTKSGKWCGSSYEEEVVVKDLGDDENEMDDDFTETVATATTPCSDRYTSCTQPPNFVVQKKDQRKNSSEGVAIATPQSWRSLQPLQENKEAADLVGKKEENKYKTKVPYPKPPKKTKEEVEDAKCKRILDRLEVRIPFFKACQMGPALRKHVKKMLNNNLSLEDGVKMITETCYEMIQDRMPKKMPDPGAFVLDCKIEDHTFEHSLCDLGSGVNLMPYSVAKKLGMTDFTPTPLVLVLADRSVRIPEGLLEDVPVKIGNCWIPADFIVLDYDRNEPKDPLILGRPFLATAGAIIDCRQGRIELKVDDETMVFEMDKSLKRPTIDGQSFMVETLDEKVFVIREEEQKTNDQPNLNTTSAAPTTATKQKAPNIKPPPSKPRYVFSKPKSNSKHTIAGKESIPPKAGALPCSIPQFLGKPHTPTAYTPPWMRRISAKYSMPLSKPPDI